MNDVSELKVYLHFENEILEVGELLSFGKNIEVEQLEKPYKTIYRPKKIQCVVLFQQIAKDPLEFTAKINLL